MPRHRTSRRTSRRMMPNVLLLANGAQPTDDCINISTLDGIAKIEKRAKERERHEISENMSNALFELRRLVDDKDKNFDRAKLAEVFDYLIECHLNSGLRDLYNERE